MQLILGDDEGAALEKARAEAEANDKEAQAAAAAQKAEEDADADPSSSSSSTGGGGGGDAAAAAAKAVGAAGAAAGVSSGGGGAEDAPMESVWWMYETQEGWLCHTREASTAVEEALRGGRQDCSVQLGTELYTVQVLKGSDGKGPCQTSEEGSVQRVRRHVVGPGLQGQWEMLSLKFAP